jgi:hypothetical protein
MMIPRPSKSIQSVISPRYVRGSLKLSDILLEFVRKRLQSLLNRRVLEASREFPVTLGELPQISCVVHSGTPCDGGKRDHAGFVPAPSLVPRS